MVKLLSKLVYIHWKILHLNDLQCQKIPSVGTSLIFQYTRQPNVGQRCPVLQTETQPYNLLWVPRVTCSVIHWTLILGGNRIKFFMLMVTEQVSRIIMLVTHVKLLDVCVWLMFLICRHVTGFKLCQVMLQISSKFLVSYLILAMSRR